MNTIGTALGCDFLIDTVIDSVIVRNAGRNGHIGYGGNSGIGIGTAAEAKEPLVVTNCFTYDCGNFGVFVETQNNPTTPHRSLGAKIVNCHAEGNYRGFGNKGSGATQFIGCTAMENTTLGFQLSQGAEGDKILGCVALRNGGAGISVESPHKGGVSISSSEVRGNGEHGIHINRTGSSNQMRDVSVVDCTIAMNGQTGIYSEGPVSGLSVSACRVFGNGQTGTNSFSTRGIRVTGSVDIFASNIILSGNSVYDRQASPTQVVGVQIAPESKNVSITGNNVVGYTDANAYQYPAGSTFEANNVPTRRYGTATLDDGVVNLWVIHNHGKIPSRITLTPLGDARVWVEDNEASRVRIRRDTTVGQLDVMWEVE